VRVDAGVVRTLLSSGFVPVVASIAADADGHPFNVNADVMASELAIGLEAGKLVYVNDVPGVIGPGGELLSELSAHEALDLLTREGVVEGGMIPKLESAVRALKAGVSRVHLLDGRVDHAVVLELFTPEGIGTMVTPDPGAQPGPAPGGET
jgi:acetylglutamate kinase